MPHHHQHQRLAVFFIMSLQILNDRSVGILLVLTVSLIWILASYLVQYLEDQKVSPFLITYICNTLFLIFLPLVWIKRKFLTKYALFRRQVHESVASEEASEESAENAGLTDKETLILAAKVRKQDLRIWSCALDRATMVDGSVHVQCVVGSDFGIVEHHSQLYELFVHFCIELVLPQ